MNFAMRTLRVFHREVVRTTLPPSRIAADQQACFTTTRAYCLRRYTASKRSHTVCRIQRHDRAHPRIGQALRRRDLTQVARFSSLSELPDLASSGVGSGTEACILRRRQSTAAPSAFQKSTEPSSLLLQSQVDLDLGTRLSPENVERLRKNLSARGLAFNLDQLLADYKHWRKVDEVKTGLEKERNDIAKIMAGLVKNKMSENRVAEKEQLTARGKAVKEQIKDIMSSWVTAEQKLMTQALKLPTDLHPRTPQAEDVVLDVCKASLEDAGSTSHMQFAERSGLLKFSNAGPRAVYLLGEAAELELSLLNTAATCVGERGFSPIAAPEMFRSLVVEGCGWCTEEILSLQAKEEERETNAYFLVGNSLLSFAAFLTKMQVKKDHLPLKMYSVGRHYQRQTDGELPGVYGLVQSNRVSAFGACQNSEETTEMHDTMVTTAWGVIQDLGLSARKRLVSAGKLTPSESLRTEVEIWVPSLQRFLPMAFVSVHNDYVSRRLMSKTSTGQPLHMVSGVVMDTGIVLPAILEYSCSRRTAAD